MTDAELLEHVAAGDRAAFEALYRRYHRRLFGFVSRFIRQPELVEEIVDDVLFVVWTDAHKFESRSRVSTWIFGIARHLTRACLRRRAEDGGLDEAPEPSTEDGAFSRWELRDSLAQALEVLSPEHRSVVVLTYFEGCSYHEIAEVLGCPVNTVKTRMFFARKHLKRTLERQRPTWGHERGDRYA